MGWPTMTRVRARTNVLLLSAEDEATVAERAWDAANALEAGSTTLSEVAAKLRSATPGSLRRAVVAADQIAAITALRAPQQIVRAASSQDLQVVFLFSGVGEHYDGITRCLYSSSAIYRDAIDACASLTEPIVEFDIRTVIRRRGNDIARPATPRPSGQRQDFLRRALEPTHRSIADDTRVAQPLTFGLQHSMAQLFESYGVEPFALLGYSVGEFVAATVAKIFSPDTATQFIARRAQLIESLPSGGMLAVPAPATVVEEFLHSYAQVATIAGPTLTVVSGDDSSLAVLESALAHAGIASRRLRVHHPFHSAAMEPITSRLKDALQCSALGRPAFPLLSNVTGTWMTDAEAMDPSYWATHIRHRVILEGNVHEVALLDGELVLVEIGPGRVLAPLVLQHRRMLGAPSPVVVSPVQSRLEDGDGRTHLLQALSTLWEHGVPVNWPLVFSPKETGAR
jgi:acyl transferase domain-containing protein